MVTRDSAVAQGLEPRGHLFLDGPELRTYTRVIAFAPGAGAEPDSARVDGVLVPFEYPEPDSVGLFLTLR